MGEKDRRARNDAADAKLAPRPNWKLFEEKAKKMEFGMLAIAHKDYYGIASGKDATARSCYDYAARISQDISSLLMKEFPGAPVESSQISGRDVMVNTLTAGSVQVVLTYTRATPPILSAMVLGEGAAFKRICDAIANLKKTLEG